VKIAILGTRGIPNNYGGFEQFAQFLSQGLIAKGHEVFVYNSHDHPYKNKLWNSVHLIHKFDPEYLVGTAGQFLYDLNCIADCRGRGFDLILQLGYTSSSVWTFLFPKSAVLVTNMDGLEWKRTKYNSVTQRFLKYAERIAVRKSDVVISDSTGIQKYILSKYNIPSIYIPYGATIFDAPRQSAITQYGVEAFNYDMLIARLEPENSIDVILEGVSKAASKRKFLVIGNAKTKYGQYLQKKYGAHNNIIFLGPQYDMDVINNLRYFSNLYFHGHTVGGTNPSLLEAMASQSLIAANRNEFNSAILNDDAFYFNTANEICELLDKTIRKSDVTVKGMISRNLEKIKDIYSWQHIIDQYEQVFNNADKTGA